jgi:TRAP-type C4-dicarboxylate transport system substrate-binding protein
MFNPKQNAALYASTAMIVAGLLSSGASAQTYEATFGHSHQNYGVQGAEAFKAHVESATGGDFVINLVRHGALAGDDREITDQLRLGELEFNKPGAGGIAGVFPQAQVHSWPFLFTDRNVFWQLPQDPEYMQYLREELLEESGGTIRLLSLMENSIRHLYTTAGPIRVPSDLTEHAIKMRTQAVPMHQTLFEALGAAQIVTVGAPERYTALQSGLIDGLEGGLASAWDAGLLEVADYVSLTGHMYEYLWFTVNEDFYQSLPVEYRQIVDDAALIAATVNNSVSYMDTHSALQQIIDAGNDVYVPTEAELQEWQDIAIPAGREFIEEEVSADFIDATMAALERTRERVNAQKSTQADD